MIRRLRRAFGGLILTATGLLGLAFALGWLAVVSTYGVSMEPGYSAGDLVVLMRADRYSVGDVAAYSDGATGKTVLHRIVDGADDGFIFQGDNNESIGPDQPPADELIGREVLHVPKIGRYASSHWTMIAIALGGFALAMFPNRRARARRPTRRLRRRR